MFPWQDILAGLCGGSVWHIYLAGFHKQWKDMLLSKKRKRKSNGKYYSESADCNVIIWPVIYVVLFALVAGSPEPANCGLATMVMWISGSCCEWNKHHEEEARPHFCCSVPFPRSMHQPGYIQEGQGVIIGYLLLGIYHRRIPGDTGGHEQVISNGVWLYHLLPKRDETHTMIDLRGIPRN